MFDDKLKIIINRQNDDDGYYVHINDEIVQNSDGSKNLITTINIESKSHAIQQAAEMKKGQSIWENIMNKRISELTPKDKETVKDLLREQKKLYNNYH